MKKSKIIALLLAMIMVMSIFVACGSDDDAGTTDDADVTETVEDTETEDDEDVEDDDMEVVVDDDTLVVGAPELNGSYINGFGNSTYDMWIKKLIGTYSSQNSYGVQYFDDNNEMQYNMTVLKDEPTITENGDGTKTYRYEINENLVWNDETPITAKDYVFGTLFTASPEWLKTGAANSANDYALKGFEPYNTGETDVFEGVALVDDYTFELTISDEYLPYYFERNFVHAGPTPLHRYSPNLDVDVNRIVLADGYEITDEDRDELLESQQYAIDDAQDALDDEIEYVLGAEEPVVDQAEIDEVLAGDYEAMYEEYQEQLENEEETTLASDLVYIIEAKMALDEEEALLAGYEDGSIDLDPAEMLMTAAANDIQYNYRFNPDVTAGPYNFVSHENNMAKVSINPHYVGNAHGEKPTIQNVIVQTVNSTLEVDLAIAGTIDLAPGVMEGDKIDKARDSDKVAYTEYPRNGYGLLRILNDVEPANHVGVRQAIAYSLDRNEFVQNIAGGYGVVLNGAYGLSEWEYVDRGQEFEEEATVYTLNTEAANESLDTTPYLYEADGTTPWDADKAQELYDADKENFDYWRHDDTGRELRVIHNGATNNEVSDLIEVQLPDNCKLSGMHYIVNPVPFNTLLDNLRYPDHDNPEQPSVFNMGIGFGKPHDPFTSYHSSQIDVGDNTERVNDPVVDEITERARYRDGEDRDGWLDGWLEFNLWYNENLPSIPLYANQYHDIYNSRVQNVTTNPFHDWSEIICDITLE